VQLSNGYRTDRGTTFIRFTDLLYGADMTLPATVPLKTRMKVTSVRLSCDHSRRSGRSRREMAQHRAGWRFSGGAHTIPKGRGGGGGEVAWVEDARPVNKGSGDSPPKLRYGRGTAGKKNEKHWR